MTSLQLCSIQSLSGFLVQSLLSFLLQYVSYSTTLVSLKKEKALLKITALLTRIRANKSYADTFTGFCVNRPET